MNVLAFFDKLLARLSASKQAELDLTKQQHRAEIFALELQTASLTDKIRNLETERDGLKLEVAAISKDHDHTHGLLDACQKDGQNLRATNGGSGGARTLGSLQY